MDDDKQLMKYLSWLDDLDQDLIFTDTDNALTIKMEQDNMTGQPSVDNTLQYDPNVTNFDYSGRVMQYNVNETILPGTMNTTQPNVMTEPYNYNNYLPNGDFYTDAALSQPHIPLKPSEQPFCVEMNHPVHPDNSYMSTSDPQLCADITSNSANFNISQETNQYTVPNDVDIKNDFFHEEKHIADDYTNHQLSINPISHDVSASENNTFSQINSHNELYCGDSSQQPINIDHATVDEKPCEGTIQNLDEVSKPTITESPIEIPAGEVPTKIEPMDVKEEVNQEVDLDTAQEQITTPALVKPPSPNVVQDETSVAQPFKVETENDSTSHPIANGVDKINIEDELSDIQMCIRNGCGNRAVNNLEWEQEFCSNECVILHCKNVFTAWVKGNEIAA